jgi:hypothetical protein
MSWIHDLLKETPAPSISQETPKNDGNYSEIIQRAATAYGLTDKIPIIERMLQAESEGNRKAVSPKGARGLMQLMPDTARAMGVKNVNDPEQNIFGGVRYLRAMYNQFGNNDALALAAYNSGPGKVLKYKGVPPIRETQKYVAKILHPISGTLTSGFNDSRGDRLHYGGDIAAPAHTPFIAPTNLRITHIREKMSNSPGGMVWGVDPQTGLQHKFHHVIPGVKVGDTISQGQPLGTLSPIKGPHLDYKIFDPAKQAYIDWISQNNLQKGQVLEQGQGFTPETAAMVADVSGQTVPANIPNPQSPEKQSAISKILTGLADSMAPAQAAAAEPPKGDWLTELIKDEGPGIPAPLPPKDYVKDAQGNYYSPKTEVEIDTGQGTAKLRMPIQVNNNPPDMATLAKAGAVDDIIAKFKILAAARFPSEDPNESYRRYFIKDGDIFFVDGNVVKREVPKGLFESIKRFGIEEGISRAPENIGAGVGFSLGGLPGAALGAAAGSELRQKFAEDFLGDKPKSLSEKAMTAAGEGAMALAGGLAGKGITAGLNKAGTMAARPGVIGKLAAHEAPSINREEMQRMISLAGRYNLQLTAPEITNSPTLQAIWRRLSSVPGSPEERIARFIEDIRMPEIHRAIQQELRGISPVGSIFRAGEEAGLAAKAIQASLEAERARVTRPLYQQAYQTAQPVDTLPVHTRIDNLMQGTAPNSPDRKALETIKALFLDEDGLPLANLEQLHSAKENLDKLLSKTGNVNELAVTSKLRRRLTIIKDELRTQMNAASPEYAEAQRLYADYSKPLNEFLFDTQNAISGKKYSQSLINRLTTKTTDKEITQIPDMVFSEPAESIKTVRQYFENHGYQDEWRALVRAHLQSKLAQVTESEANQGGAFGAAFRKKVFFRAEDKEKLQVALDPLEYRSLSDFFDLLARTGKIVYANSQTITQHDAGKAIKGSIGGVRGIFTGALEQWATVRDALVNPRQLINALNERWAVSHADVVLDAMMRPEMARRLSAVKRLPDNYKKVIEFTALIGGLPIKHAKEQPSHVPQQK